MSTIIGRIQTPADVNGERQNIEVITSSDAVSVGNKTLTRVLDELGGIASASSIILSEEMPSEALPCLWGKIRRVDNYVED